MANIKITPTDLDFDAIKTNLKAYLKNQSTFQDYDFDGSGLSVLVDILAYNTHYNALYNNLTINEMFLDSARKRNSVVSIAKELGYRPQSAKCAKATVNITLSSASSTVFSISAASPFTTIVDNKTYNFYSESNLVSPSASHSYTFNNVTLIEKSNILSYKYTVADGIQYLIPNTAVDLSTLTVSVQESSGSSITTPFMLADTIVDVTNISNVYWVKEIDNGLYELIFGDDIIGTKLSNGNVVTINYCVSSLDAPNGARVFNYTGLPSGWNASISTTSPASGGSGAEDIDSIRFNAPRAYAAQNRGVTANDYKALIYANVPAAKSVSVWGGEDNIPPVYGKTFICIKPKTTDVLTTAQKTDILNNVLKTRNILTVVPEIVDPEYINIVLKTTVYYNELATNRTADTIKSIITDVITNYDSNELQRFDGIFRHSKLSKLIDESEDSIVSNVTTVTLKRNVIPKYNIYANYTINLINPLYYSGVPEDIVLSSGFYIQGSSDVHYLVDDGIGNITLFKLSADNTKIIVNSTIGTVDYAKGYISISNLNISSLVGDFFTFYIKPSSNDVVSALTQIAQVSLEDLSVTVLADKTMSGDLRGGQNYTFTSSRI